MKTKITTYPISNESFTAINESGSILFFDIETTGFSRQTSFVYLIGYGYLEQGIFKLTQLLIENEDDENELLTTFFHVASSFDCLLTFNGLLFDLPFLIERGRLYNINGGFLKNKFQIDLFRQLKSLRYILTLENTKQKTFERFLSIQRDDPYDGGQLIPVFYDYLHQHSLEQENLLWTHNLEDVFGMVQLLPLLSYQKMLNSHEPTETTYEYLPLSNELFITQTTSIFVPKPISYRLKHYYLSLENNKRKLIISLTKQNYRLPLSPTSDYVYVKSEDMVIPKALATTMDKDNYCKATSKNCFLQVQENCIGLNVKKHIQLSDFSLTYFKSDDKKDSNSYFSITEILAHPDQYKIINIIFSSIIDEITAKK